MSTDRLRTEMSGYITGRGRGQAVLHPPRFLTAVDAYCATPQGSPQALQALREIVGEVPQRPLPREVAR